MYVSCDQYARTIRDLLNICSHMGTTLKVTGTTTTSGDTFSDGLNAGKAQGKVDAINGVDNNSCDVSSHSNDYCAGYKVGYRANHVITNLVR